MTTKPNANIQSTEFMQHDSKYLTKLTFVFLTFLAAFLASFFILLKVINVSIYSSHLMIGVGYVLPHSLAICILMVWLFSKDTRRSENQVPLITILQIGAVTLLTVLLVIIYFTNYYINVRESIIYTYLIQMAVIIGIPNLWKYFIDRRRQKDELWEDMEKDLTKSTSDLQLLKSQINPHFLYNALNTLYGTALIENANHTGEAIQKLGDMMRYMLDDNVKEYIPLKREIEYLENYLSIQKLRFQENSNLKYEVEIQKNDVNYDIVPMLLIPFVENAFKHGISASEPSWIKIKLTINNGLLSLKVENSVHQNRTQDPERNKGGIGLINVKSRLELFYMNEYKINIKNNDQSFNVHLELQIKPNA